ncbi:MAG: aminotransferase class V-fold PLP-dependent enzyme [Pseudomonadota bacterium]
MAAQKFPQAGHGSQAVMDALRAAKASDVDWRSGRLNSLVHFANSDVLDISKAAATAYFSENALGLAAFPSIKQMMQDLGRWVGDLLQAPETAGATITTGGTESIFLAIVAARERFLKRHRCAANGPLNIVVPQSAHPAFSKTGFYLGIEVRRAALAEDFAADPQAMAALIDEGTIMLAASAPAYPHGVIDPVEDIAALAVTRDLWMHVDACVGGFTLPFLRDLGHPLPGFDFAIDGVTSMSADLHKYGFTAKGCSALAVREEALVKHHRFAFEDWPRGAYQSDGFCGSRPASPIASAWAVLQFLGRDGYCDIMRTIIAGRDKYIAAVQSHRDLTVWGQPRATVFSYGAMELDIYDIAATMAEVGWNPHLITQPKGIHLGQLTPVHAGVADAYAEDLAAAVKKVKTGYKPASRITATYGG